MQHVCLGFHFVAYQLATWSIRREQLLSKVSVSGLFLGFFVRNEICLVRSLYMVKYDLFELEFERRICLSEPLTSMLIAR